MAGSFRMKMYLTINQWIGWILR